MAARKAVGPRKLVKITKMQLTIIYHCHKFDTAYHVPLVVIGIFPYMECNKNFDCEPIEICRSVKLGERFTHVIYFGSTKFLDHTKNP